jgi:hypothetical protein
MNGFRTAAAVCAGAAMVALAGCATSGQVTAGGPPILSTPPPTHPPMVVATMADNGHTVTVADGQRLVVRLDSTFWTFAPTSAALRVAGSPLVESSKPCVPGGGCGSVTAFFDAVNAGQVTVAAARTSCGEAMRCVGSAGTYRLTVVVH